MFLSHFARTPLRPLPRPSTDRPYIATLTVSHENFGEEEQFYILSGANLFTTGCANPISWLPLSPVRQKMPQQAPNEL